MTEGSFGKNDPSLEMTEGSLGKNDPSQEMMETSLGKNDPSLAFGGKKRSVAGTGTFRLFRLFKL